MVLFNTSFAGFYTSMIVVFSPPRIVEHVCSNWYRELSPRMSDWIGKNLPQGYVFLHTELLFHETPTSRGWITVEPLIHNITYIRGLAAEPLVGKLLPFYGNQFSRKDWLRVFIIGKLATFGQIVRHFPDSTPLCVASLVAEALLLHWPQTWVSSGLLSLPRRQKGRFCIFVRVFGRQLKHDKVLASMLLQPEVLCDNHGCVFDHVEAQARQLWSLLS